MVFQNLRCGIFNGDIKTAAMIRDYFASFTQARGYDGWYCSVRVNKDRMYHFLSDYVIEQDHVDEEFSPRDWVDIEFCVFEPELDEWLELPILECYKGSWSPFTDY